MDQKPIVEDQNLILAQQHEQEIMQQQMQEKVTVWGQFGVMAFGLENWLIQRSTPPAYTMPATIEDVPAAELILAGMKKAKKECTDVRIL